jgi:hypothetical protein
MRALTSFAPVAALAVAVGVVMGSGCGGDSATDAGDAGIAGDGGPSCDGGQLDLAANLCWQHPKAPQSFAMQDAIDYCNDLSSGARTDWVLPSRDDFTGLLGGCDGDVTSWHNGYCDPCADSATCGALFGADAGWYWSSSLYDTSHAWIAHFGDGYVNTSEIGFNFNVRCVRPGP